MIQITRKALFPEPLILQTTGRTERTLLEQAYDNGARTFEFKKSVYAAPEVKDLLIRVQHYKCCFCESKIGHIDDGDVEHFRPKSACKQAEGQPLTKPGYYWMAYHWDNLFLACTKCNRRNKGNLFPLQTPGNRACSHNDDLRLEDPLFIHPQHENPEQHLTFRDENILPLLQSERGKASISCLRLDRSELTQHRAELLSNVKALYEVIQLLPDIAPDIRQQAMDILRQQQDAHTEETHQYAGMFRAFFKEYPLPCIS